MPEQRPQTQKPKFNAGVIFSFILVIAIIGLFSFFLFRNANASYEFKLTEFVTALENNRIQTVYQNNKEDSVIILSGQYKTTTDNEKHQYIINLEKNTYIQPQSYRYVDESITTSITYKDTDASKSLLNLILDKQNETASAASGQYKLEVYSAVDPYQTDFWSEWGPTIILMIGSAILVIFLFSRLAGAVGGTNSKALDFNKSRARRVDKSKIKFDDVAGCDEEKTEMQELVAYLKEPKKFSKFGAKLPKGVLLVGPPGCGKTLLAKAVAGEAGVPFYSISGSDFVEMFVGVGAGRVRDMFKTAKENAPCLVFIDEIDAVGRQRGAGLGGGNDEREQTLNQLLVEMDGFADNSGIIVIAATNRDDVLDPALMRAGRFDRKITVSLPDRDGREAIFHVHSRNKVLAPGIDFKALAKRTVGFSGADIENIMNEAAILAVRRNKNEVSIDEIDEAIDRRIAGPAKSSRSLNPHEREIIAYHESGHAIIGLKLEHSDKVQKITIIPRGNTGGHVRMTPEDDRFLLTKKELEARIVGYLGGRSSEETFFDDVSSGAQNDIEMATQIARMMVTELGMSSLGPIQYERDTGSVFLGRDYTSSQKNFSVATAEEIDKEVRKIIDDAHALAKKIIKDNKKEVTLIAKTLLEHEQITAEEIDYLLKNGHLQRDEVKEEPKNVEVKEEPNKVEEDKPSTTKKTSSKKPKAE